MLAGLLFSAWALSIHQSIGGRPLSFNVATAEAWIAKTRWHLWLNQSLFVQIVPPVTSCEIFKFLWGVRFCFLVESRQTWEFGEKHAAARQSITIVRLPTVLRHGRVASSDQTSCHAFRPVT